MHGNCREPKGNEVSQEQRRVSRKLTSRPFIVHRVSPMDPHARAVSVWFRIAGLVRQKELAVDIIEGEIRSAHHEVWLEAARLVLTDNEPIAIARQLREMAEQAIRPKG